jgi:small subunit ribosomal protein S19e
MENCITVRDVSPNLFNSVYADFLKKSGRIEIPSWINIVKTGIGKKNAPDNPDWFFLKIAALARKFYLNRGKGVGSLTRKFGNKKKKGTMPFKKTKSSGKIIRFALQMLEKLKIITRDEEGKRKIAKKAKLDMDKRANKIFLNLKN